MKKINLINIVLLLVLLISLYYTNRETNVNLEKIEKNILEKYYDLNNKSLIKENEELTKLLNLKNINLDFSVARGYFINPYEEFIINKGMDSDIKNGFLVMNEERLIGFVRNVHNDYSNVELLENLNKKISIRVNNSYGILENINKRLIVTGISSKDMKIGDSVYTSGLTSVLGNVFIGKIEKIIINDDTFETKAYLSIEKNYNKYKYLLVVKK